MPRGTTLDQLEQGVQALLAAGSAANTSAEAAEELAKVESIVRQLDALRIARLGDIGRQGLHYDDGHASAKVMLRHVGKLSGPHAAGVDRCERMFRDLDQIATAYRGGTIPTDHVRLLGRVWGNARVRRHMEPKQGWFIGLARRLPYPRFEAKVREWEQLTDMDGAEPANDRTHENRNFQLTVNHFDRSWDSAGIFRSLMGASMHEILGYYVEAEFDADWSKALADRGDAACTADLERTDAQRRADAVFQIFQDAAANPGGSVPVGFTHHVMWSESAYQEMLARVDGRPPKPFDLDTDRCETRDGIPLEPNEAVFNSLVNRFRRMIFDSASVTIDMGTVRSFRGNVRTAAHAPFVECYWPGCWVPVSRCETDHLHDHAKGGCTDPGNGAPGCGRHNRFKQKGYRVWRDETGEIHVLRPDGTKIN